MAQEKPMTEQAESTGEKQPKIRRGRVDSLTLYEITDYELDILATGSPSSIYLNFAIFFISIAISFLIALSTATIASDRIFTIFVVIVVIGFISGGVLFCLWLRNRKSISTIIKRIKQRIPPEETIEEAQDQSQQDNQPDRE
ncbi:MAG: phage holin family protein [Nitrospirota bacterium]